MLYSWLRRHPKVLDSALAAVLAFLGVASAAVMIFHPGSSAVGLTRVVGIPVALTPRRPAGVPPMAPRSPPSRWVIDGRCTPGDNGPTAGPAETCPSLILLYTLAAYTPRRVSVTGLAVCMLG